LLVRPEHILVVALKMIHRNLLLFPILQQPCCHSQLLVICARLFVSTGVVAFSLQLKVCHFTIFQMEEKSMKCCKVTLLFKGQMMKSRYFRHSVSTAMTTTKMTTLAAAAVAENFSRLSMLHSK
jgi:hypothetical protein